MLWSPAQHAESGSRILPTAASPSLRLCPWKWCCCLSSVCCKLYCIPIVQCWAVMRFVWARQRKAGPRSRFSLDPKPPCRSSGLDGTASTVLGKMRLIPLYSYLLLLNDMIRSICWGGAGATHWANSIGKAYSSSVPAVGRCAMRVRQDGKIRNTFITFHVAIHGPLHPKGSWPSWKLLLQKLLPGRCGFWSSPSCQVVKEDADGVLPVFCWPTRPLPPDMGKLQVASWHPVRWKQLQLAFAFFEYMLNHSMLLRTSKSFPRSRIFKRLAPDSAISAGVGSVHFK